MFFFRPQNKDVSAKRRKHELRKARNGQAGMTLIEIMVVVMIMGLIMGAVGISVFGWYRSAQERTTKTTVDSVSNALWKWSQDQVHSVHGSGETCPQSLEVLIPEYIKSRQTLRDAWGTPLNFRCEGDTFCVWSSGRNKRNENGGGDDITSDGCGDMDSY